MDRTAPRRSLFSVRAAFLQQIAHGQHGLASFKAEEATPSERTHIADAMRSFDPRRISSVAKVQTTYSPTQRRSPRDPQAVSGSGDAKPSRSYY